MNPYILIRLHHILKCVVFTTHDKPRLEKVETLMTHDWESSLIIEEDLINYANNINKSF